MDKSNDVLKEISHLIRTIESEYPELYRFLDEIPMTLPRKRRPEVGQKQMEEYLQSLRTLLRHHLETLKPDKNEREKV